MYIYFLIYVFIMYIFLNICIYNVYISESSGELLHFYNITLPCSLEEIDALTKTNFRYAEERSQRIFKRLQYWR